MIKKALWVLVFSLAVTVGTVAASEGAIFGTAPSADLDLTDIASILDAPDEWAGKRVKIAGDVAGVCTKQGCWMDLTSPDDVTLRVKVDDGVIVFPQDATGHSAVAEGTVEILDMERDKYEAWLRHVAEEEGREFDPSDVGEAPYRIVRLRGTGAEIADL